MGGRRVSKKICIRLSFRFAFPATVSFMKPNLRSFTILKDYFLKNSLTILLSVEPCLNVRDVIQTATEGKHTNTVSFALDSDKYAEIKLAT